MHDPVIILAPPRSFTSVICAMLGQHPQLYGVPELNLFMAETIRERERLLAKKKFLDHGLLRVVAQLFGEEQTLQSVSLAERWLDVRSNCTCAAVLRELLEKLDPRILVDKSITTVSSPENLQRALRTFPNARFMHLLRHPRAVCESLWNLGGKIAARYMEAIDYSTDPPTLDVQKIWYNMHHNICCFLEGVPRENWLRVRGEDVLSEPDQSLQQIGNWLGLTMDEKALEEMKSPEKSPYACLGPGNALLGNDPGFLKDPELRPYSKPSDLTLDGPLNWRDDEGEFSPELRELATEFGYQ
ncbi:MAG: sulfotransferase [bacterium]